MIDGVATPYRHRASGIRLTDVAAVIAVTAALSGSCRQSLPSRVDVPSGTLRVGAGQLAASSPLAGLRQLTQLLTVEGLVRVGENGRLEPILAERWTSANGGRTLSVKLRPAVKFHDGSPLDAETVVRGLPEGLRSFWGPLADQVEHIKAIEQDTLQISFRRPSPLLQEMLEVTIRKPGAATIGTGPYMMSPGSSTILRANGNYYLGSPRIDQITVTSFPAIRSAWAELLRDRIDMLWEVGPDALDSLQSSTTVATFTYTRHYQYVLAFNTRRPALRSSAVRRALNLAVDRVALVQQALNGHGVASSGPIWPGYWALPTPKRPFEFDPALAAATLASSRQGRAFGEHVRFVCLIASDAVYERIALELKRQLQAIDVDMEIRAMPSDELFAAEQAQDFDAVLADVISGPTVLRVYNFWKSGSSGNPGGFGDKSVDAALERVSQATDEATYRTAVGELQQAFIDDPPAIFLAWQQRARAISKRFAVPPPENGRDVISTIRLWSPRNNDARFASRN